VAAELALGIAGGEQRARALEHAATCAECRRVLDEHAVAADELMLVAPAHEPPIGFESRVLERFPERETAHPSTPRRLTVGPRRLKMAMAIMATAAATAGGMLLAFRDDRRLASDYREILAVAEGKYFDAVHLREPSGARAGQVLGYQGSPSWMVVTVARRYRSHPYRCELVTRDGQRIRLRAFRLDEATGSWGQTIPIDLRDVARLRVVDRESGEVLGASFRED
jgi:hypothetical protein